MIKFYLLDDSFIYKNETKDSDVAPYLAVAVEPPKLEEGKSAKWVTTLSPITDLGFGLTSTGYWEVIQTPQPPKEVTYPIIEYRSSLSEDITITRIQYSSELVEIVGSVYPTATRTLVELGDNGFKKIIGAIHSIEYTDSPLSDAGSSSGGLPVIYSSVSVTGDGLYLNVDIHQDQNSEPNTATQLDYAVRTAIKKVVFSLKGLI